MEVKYSSHSIFKVISSNIEFMTYLLGLVHLLLYFILFLRNYKVNVHNYIELSPTTKMYKFEKIYGLLAFNTNVNYKITPNLFHEKHTNNLNNLYIFSCGENFYRSCCSCVCMSDCFYFDHQYCSSKFFVKGVHHFYQNFPSNLTTSVSAHARIVIM